MGVRIVDTAETYRLIADDRGRYAVIEARCRNVYSLDAHHSRRAPDSLEGMAQVVDEDGWCDERHARRCFDEAVNGERIYSQIVW